MSQIGILYSVATGIVLRTINPDLVMGDAHLDWVMQNMPTGTALIRIDKSAIGADDKNCPNMDFLIPYVQQNNGVNLSYGVSCSIVNALNTTVATVLCCPVLYGDVVSVNALGTLIQKPSNIGNTYNPITQTFSTPVVITPSI
jgi:hypothetical protein